MFTRWIASWECFKSFNHSSTAAGVGHGVDRMKTAIDRLTKNGWQWTAANCCKQKLRTRKVQNWNFYFHCTIIKKVWSAIGGLFLFLDLSPHSTRVDVWSLRRWFVQMFAYDSIIFRIATWSLSSSFVNFAYLIISIFSHNKLELLSELITESR